jgi:hypothetical protein
MDPPVRMRSPTVAQTNAVREQSEPHASFRWFRRRWTTELIFALLVSAATVLVLSPVLRRSGWSLNAASTAPLLIVQMYASHFRHLDFFPVWSSSDAFGMGSPVLLYYHRTFFYVAGLLMAWGGLGLKASVVTTIGLFLFVGAYGMRQALRLVTDSQLLCTVGSLGFLFTNYAFTDWLFPRGDLAEFSAMMLVPWLLYWCLMFVKDGRFSYLLIPIMVLLVNTHSAIALTALFALGVALIAFLWRAGWAGLRSVLRRMAISLGAIAILLAPLLIAWVRLGQYYDPQTKNLSVPVSTQFISLNSYFVDGSHRWLASDSQNFVQIDYALWVPIALAVAGGLTYWAWTKRSPSWWSQARRTQAPILAFLVVSLVIYLFLQLRLSLFVYRIIQPLQVISYPWRMLAYVTPIALILVVALADSLHRVFSNRAVWGTVAAAWLASLIVLSPLTSSVDENYGFLASPGNFPPMTLFTAPTEVDLRHFNGFFLGSSTGALYGNYLPKLLQADGQELPDDSALYSHLHQNQSGAQSLSGVPCRVEGPSRWPFESLEVRFAVSCAGKTQLALPISYNQFSSVFEARAGGTFHRIAYVHIPTDPRIVISVTSAKPVTVVVHLPTLWGMLG